MLLGKLDKLIVVDGTSTCDDEAVGGVVLVDIVEEVVAGEVADVLLRAEDGAAETSALECCLMQVVEDYLFVLLVNLD